MMHRNTVLLGDVVERLRELPDNSIDAIVTDPPAGISFMGRDWDHDKGGREQWVVWMTEVMAEALRVAKPGAHALVWALPRTSHWTGTAIEAAGWEVRDRIVHLFGSGFPKSKNIGNGFGTALKPAAEDWWLARKPLAGTVAANVQQWGTGALNIDGTRIGTGSDKGVWPSTDRPLRQTSLRLGISSPGLTDINAGRWPANVTLDEYAAAMLDEQSGMTSYNPAGTFAKRRSDQTDGTPAAFSVGKAGDGIFGYGDTGGASRFFYVAKASRADREAGLVGLPESVIGGDGAGAMPQQECGTCGTRLMLNGKTTCEHDDDRRVVSRPRQNDHPTVKPFDLMRWLCRLVGGQPGSLILDPFAGSGSTLRAARAEGFDFLGIERDRHYYRLACLRAGLPDPGEDGA